MCPSDGGFLHWCGVCVCVCVQKPIKQTLLYSRCARTRTSFREFNPRGATQHIQCNLLFIAPSVSVYVSVCLYVRVCVCVYVGENADYRMPSERKQGKKRVLTRTHSELITSGRAPGTGSKVPLQQIRHLFLPCFFSLGLITR